MAESFDFVEIIEFRCVLGHRKEGSTDLQGGVFAEVTERGQASREVQVAEILAVGDVPFHFDTTFFAVFVRNEAGEHADRPAHRAIIAHRSPCIPLHAITAQLTAEVGTQGQGTIHSAQVVHMRLHLLAKVRKEAASADGVRVA